MSDDLIDIMRFAMDEMIKVSRMPSSYTAGAGQAIYVGEAGFKVASIRLPDIYIDLPLSGVATLIAKQILHPSCRAFQHAEEGNFNTIYHVIKVMSDAPLNLPVDDVVNFRNAVKVAADELFENKRQAIIDDINKRNNMHDVYLTRIGLG